MTVSAEVAGRVGWITLDRPPENRLDAGELEELDVAVGRVAEAEVAVAVIRSGSEQFFSAGADLRDFLERSPEQNLTACRRAHQVLGRFADEAPLFLAAIAGHALGLGYEIALACDIRLAAQGRYRIGLPEVTLGLLPGTGGAQRLARRIGPGRALELLTTGRTVAPADQPGQPLGAAGGGQQPQADLGQADPVAALGGDADVAGQRDLVAAAEGVSGDGRDEQGRLGREAVQHLVGAAAHDHVLVGRPLQERLDVGPGGEELLVGRPDHRHRHLGLGDLADRLVQLLQEAGVVAVGRRPVQRDPAHPVADLGGHRHVVPLTGPGRRRRPT